MTIRSVRRFACWITTDAHSQYLTLNAFARQQWLCERASMVHYTRTLPVLLIYLTPMLSAPQAA
jgi:hypothetical protein